MAASRSSRRSMILQFGILTPLRLHHATASDSSCALPTRLVLMFHLFIVGRMSVFSDKRGGSRALTRKNDRLDHIGNVDA